MKLKNTTILALINQGLQSTTEHDVPVKDAYKAIRFRAAVDKANKDIGEKRNELVKSAGIEDGQKFDERMKELRAIQEPTEEQKQELSGMQEKLKKFEDLYKELLNDESELEGVKAMPYESYHILAKENKAVKIPGTEVSIDLFSVFAGELDGVLWEAPKEEE